MDTAAIQRNWAFSVYALYLLSSLTGITSIIGVVMAYIKIGEADEIWRSHFIFQIRTFWWSIVFALISCILIVVVIGFFLLGLVGLWFIARSIVGLIKTANGAPIPAPRSLLLGL